MSALVAAPQADGTREATRRRVSIIGPVAEPIPVRSCAGEDIGWQPMADRPRVRLTVRGRRLVAAITVLVFGAAVFVLGQQIVSSLRDEPRFTHTTTVQVGAGQSLWSVAQETNPGVDPRQVIEEIADLNNLRTASDVVPGQTLVVPAH